MYGQYLASEHPIANNNKEDKPHRNMNCFQVYEELLCTNKYYISLLYQAIIVILSASVLSHNVLVFVHLGCYNRQIWATQIKYYLYVRYTFSYMYFMHFYTIKIDHEI